MQRTFANNAWITKATINWILSGTYTVIPRHTWMRTRNSIFIPLLECFCFRNQIDNFSFCFESKEIKNAILDSNTCNQLVKTIQEIRMRCPRATRTFSAICKCYIQSNKTIFRYIYRNLFPHNACNRNSCTQKLQGTSSGSIFTFLQSFPIQSEWCSCSCCETQKHRFL